eukprot:augustus_masked-scaffold_3-processed-gene-13.58-mRNA-1 protein AED:1.00 eAED:1.00 QI:0/0/0/0/1/1/2/165/60
MGFPPRQHISKVIALIVDMLEFRLSQLKRQKQPLGPIKVSMGNPRTSFYNHSEVHVIPIC